MSDLIEPRRELCMQMYSLPPDSEKKLPEAYQAYWRDFHSDPWLTVRDWINSLSDDEVAAYLKELQS